MHINPEIPLETISVNLNITMFVWIASYSFSSKFVIDKLCWFIKDILPLKIQN